MPRVAAAVAPTSFTRFGELLKYLRRRARMTQRALAIEVGYSEVHISRLESSYRPPNEQTLLALFVPALDVQDAPELVARLLELAAAGRASQPNQPASVMGDLAVLPLPPTSAIVRHAALQQLRSKLINERVVAVCALAGMGKTSLVATLARMEAPTRPVFWLTFTAGVTNSIAALLRQLAMFLLAHGQQQVRSLVEGATSPGHTFTFDAQIALLGATLARLARTQLDSDSASSGGLPLLCFDNVHLVQDDPVIMQVLSYLAADTPVALVLISRTAIALPGIAELRLAGLERDEGLTLIAQLKHTLDRIPAERLLDKTGGSPMLLRLALGQLDQAADAVGVITHLEHAPQVVTYLLDTTLRQLSSSATQLLALIAIVRRPINLYDQALLALLQPGDGIDRFPLALADVQHHCLVDHPTQAILHPLLRDHLHATLAADQPRSARLHTLAARWSERVAMDLLEAAYHYAAAGHIDRAGELLAEQRHLIIAKGRIFEAVAIIDTLLRQVQQRSAGTDTTRQLLTLRADMLIGTVRAAEAENNYWAALQHTTQPTLRAPIAARLAECLVQRGQAQAALDVCADIHTTLNDSHPLLVAQLFAVEGHAQLTLSNYDAAYHAANQVLARLKPLARATQSSVAALQVQSYQIIAAVMRYRQQYGQATTQLQRAIAAAHQGNLVQFTRRCQSDMATIYFALGDLERAIDVCVDMVPQLQAAHDSYTMARLLSTTGLSYLLHGEVTKALAVVEQACRIAEDIGDAHTLADSQLRRARILIAAGRIREARSSIERLLARATATGEMQLQGYVLDRLAMVHLLNDDAQAAIVTLEHALALPAGTSDGKLRADLLNHLALALLLCGKDDQAEHMLVTTLPKRVPPSTVLTHDIIHAMLALARGDDRSHVAATAASIAARADAMQHFLYTNAAHRLRAACTYPPPRIALPHLLWVDAT